MRRCMKYKRVLIYFLLVFTSQRVLATNRNECDSLYRKGLDLIRYDIEESKLCASKMAGVAHLTQVQKAHLNYLKAKIHFQEQRKNKAGKSVIDTVKYAKEYEKGIDLIGHGKATEGLEILFHYIETHKKTIQDSLKNSLELYIVEGFRINEEYQKAIHVLKGIIGNPVVTQENKTAAYNRLAAVYDAVPNFSHEQRVDSVKKYSELTIKLAKQFGYHSLIASSQNELASLYRLNNTNLDLAELYSEQAYQGFIKAGLFRNAMNTAIIISDIFLRRGQPENASEACYKVLGYLDIVGNEDIFMRVYLQLANSNAKAFHFYEAYEFLSVGRLLQVILNDSNIDSRIAEMSAKYDLAMKEAKIAESQLEISIQQQRIQYLIIATVLLVIALIFATLFFIFKRKNLLQKASLEQAENEKLSLLMEKREQQLENKNSEIVRFLADNLEKSNTLQEIKKSLKNGKSSREVIGMINSSLNSEQSWKNVLFDFQQLHPEFMSTIIEKHPDLTKNEVRLSILLALGLSTKEIAQFQAVSEAAVKKGRQRLRKKLQIDENTDLKNYFKNFDAQ